MESSVNNILGIREDLKDVKSPFELFRKLRPYYFSDSRVVREMSKEIFEYNMSKLSSDMKQDMFEEMTRQMVCKLITPNLIPQTGPTGGGDGKTDIETHPVDSEISDKWYYSDACKGNEKWAFAISCKAEWKPKMESDVKKIISTNRGFQKIFFCTNQLVSSKIKADLYDKYKTTYNVEVTILDLNWYSQAVYENDCYDIAVKSLNLGTQLQEKVEEGPNDKARREQLKQLDESIQITKVTYGLNTSYIEDLLTAAILCRELEHPKSIVAGRFALAIEQAKLHGTKQQVFNIIYQKAWTEFYWNENPKAMYEQYVLLKDMLNQEINVTRIEKLYNLRNLIQTSTDCHLFDNPQIIEDEDKYWQSMYETLSTDTEHQSSFLYLKICLLETKMFNQIISKSDGLNDTLDELKNSLQDSVAHIDIPFETHAMIFNQAGVYISDNPIYEDIIDIIAEIYRKMSSEVAYAEMHYDRGVQNLSNKEYLSAIKHLGKCIIAYQKESTKGNLVQASGMLGAAYQELDLMYSAKVLFMKALSLLFHQTETEGPIDHLVITILFELCRLELKLGQVNSFFNWLYLLDLIANAHKSFVDESYNQQRMELDSSLAAIIISSQPSDKNWELLPSLCETFGLQVAKDAALYKLDYQDELSEEFKDILLKDENFKERIAQISKSSLSLFPLSLASKEVSEQESLVQGCHIKASYRSDMRTQAYVEMFLAFMESFLATMTHKDIAIAFPNINLDFRVKNSGKTEVKKGSRTTEYIVKINQKTATDNEIWTLCTQLLAFFVSQNSMLSDFRDLFERKNKEDSLGERLAILGNHYREFKLNNLSNYRSYLEQWFTKDMKKYPIKEMQSKTSEAYNPNNKQAKQIITDLIDYPLWDKAKWSGCGYLMTYDASEPPLVILMYKDIHYAKQIFEKWENDFRAKKLNLKLTFITGVDAEHPKWYKVIIAPDIKKIFANDDNKDSRYVVASSRFHLMQPSDDTNIRMFREQYSKFHYAGISAAETVNNQLPSDINKRYPRVIPITNIEFREAWTIGENDPDSMAILPTDKPIIPQGKEQEAPVLKLIESKKQRYGKL